MEERFYRNWTNNLHLKKFKISYKETDLLIRAPEKFPQLSLRTVTSLRKVLEKYITKNESFYKSLKPVTIPASAPPQLQLMATSTRKVGVGPMAAVAGLFAETTGKAILEKTEEVIVENGGDIFISVKNDPSIGIYAGDKSPFSGRLGFKISAASTPTGICTSAGTVGPSLSKGQADAVTVISPSTTLADAAATALGNMLSSREELDQVINYGKNIDGVTGLLIIIGDKIGIWGNLELVKMNQID